jgi:hypothetical protein
MADKVVLRLVDVLVLIYRMCSPQQLVRTVGFDPEISVSP